MGTSNALSIPDVLLAPSRTKSSATYVDVNPTPDEGTPDLLMDGAAVLTGIRNLILSPRGCRTRIFGEDFFSGVYELLHEPLDEMTAAQVNLSIYQSLKKWEPRITLYPSDCTTAVDALSPGFLVRLSFTIGEQAVTGEFLLPNL